MSDWVVVPCLLALRDEFNALAPSRDKGADGTIGDSAHTSSSDHTPDEDSDVLRDHDADDKNEVHALDIDSTGPWPAGRTFHEICMEIIRREKIKWLDANDKCRLNYMIHDGYIYDKDNDFEPVKYNGSDQHTNHAHFSSRYETSCENDTRPWGVYEEDEMDQVEFTSLLSGALNDTTVRERMTRAVLGTDGVIASPSAANSKNADGTANEYWAGGSFLQNLYNMLAAHRSADVPAILAEIGAVPEAIKGSTVEETASILKAILGDDAAAVGALLQA